MKVKQLRELLADQHMTFEELFLERRSNENRNRNYSF